MFRILITDASYKHSIGLQRYIHQAVSDVELVGHDNAACKIARHYGYLDSIVSDVPLAQVIMDTSFDMIIPVGAESVALVSRLRPELAMLPSAESIQICLDKNATMELADRVGVPRPRSVRIRSLDEFERCNFSYPCVVKPTLETEAGAVRYAKNQDECASHISKALSELSEGAEDGILVQEYIQGTGVGFFALLNHGQPIRIFMHRRIREYPVTGGMSTAACAFYHKALKDYGLRLLTELKWHGVAMVEFKYDEPADRLSLMEINPKFWGSLELALKSGVNFGADLIRLYRGEQLDYGEEYNRKQHFYWPLDGDFLNLLYTHRLGCIRDYRGPHAATDVGYSRIADAKRLAKTLIKLVTDKK